MFQFRTFFLVTAHLSPAIVREDGDWNLECLSDDLVGGTMSCERIVLSTSI
jgi:hypothetical protein